MAEIVLGIGCAHTPQLHTAAKDWAIRGDRDKKDGVAFWYKGERLKYAEVERRRKEAGFDPDLSQAFAEESLRRAHRAIDALHEVYLKSGANVMVIFGNDQHEIFLNQLCPAFAVLAGESFENMPRKPDQISRLPPGIHLADPGHIPDEHTCYPGQRDLAVKIIETLMAAEFDVTASFEQPRVEAENAVMDGMPHAFGFIYKQLMRDLVIPHVPILTNTFFPPNQPTAARCLKMGRIVGRAIAEWESDAKVCVVASGGLSHFLVDEDWDREFLAALMSDDLERITDWHEGYYQAGSSECKSWIACAAAVSETGLKPHLQDYVPLYRTPGGTGSSCGFLTWTK